MGDSISSSNSPIIIYCNTRIATKNGTIFYLTHYPKVGQNEFFSIEFRNNNIRTAIPIDVTYKTHSPTSQLLKFRNTVSISRILNQIDLPKKYYNSPTREKFTTHEEIKLDFSRSMAVDTLENIVDSSKTYRIELYGLNEDDASEKEYIIGNISFPELSVDIPDDGLVTDKFSGSGGVWL